MEFIQCLNSQQQNEFSLQEYSIKQVDSLKCSFKRNSLKMAILKPIFQFDALTTAEVIPFSAYFARSIVFSEWKKRQSKYDLKNTSLLHLPTSNHLPEQSIPFLGSDIFEENSSAHSFPFWIPEENKDISKVEELKSCISFILCRIIERIHLSKAEFRMFLIFLNRICLNDGKKAFIDISWSNAAMIVVTGLLLASKIQNDRCLKNSFWSSLFHVDLNRINESELCMLEVLQWRLQVSENEWEKSEEILQQLSVMNDSGWKDQTIIDDHSSQPINS